MISYNFQFFVCTNLNVSSMFVIIGNHIFNLDIKKKKKVKMTVGIQFGLHLTE
jgi:hypothetical protein